MDYKILDIGKSSFQTNSEILITVLQEELNRIDSMKITKIPQTLIENIFKIVHCVNKDNIAVWNCLDNASEKMGIIALIPYVLASRKVMILTPSRKRSIELATSFGTINTNNCFYMTSELYKDYFELTSSGFIENADIVKSKNLNVNIYIKNLAIVQDIGFNNESNTDKFKNGRVIGDDIKKYFEKFSTIIIDESRKYPQSFLNSIENNFKHRQLIYI